MYRNVPRRLSLHEQRNRLTIGLAIILVICIYLTIDSIEKLKNETNFSLKSPLKVYLCPELSSSSKGYFRVDFTKNVSINYSSICKSTDILLIYILSTARNFQRRNAIRQTWAKKKDYQQLNEICFIFIVGLLGNHSNLPYNGDIRHEASIYQDIVQLNINETYQNVVYKEVGAIKWSHIYASQIPFLFKTDDDLIIDSILLKDIVKFFIENRTDHSRHMQKHQQMQDFIQEMNRVDKYTLFKGMDMGGIPTLRSGKFGVHQLAWNDDHLPSYCSGFGFLFSSFIRDRLYRASLCFANEYVPGVGDLFISGFIAGAASVRCSGWPMMYAQTSDACGPLFKQQPQLLVCSTPLHMGGQTYSDFYTAWQAILTRHIACSTKTTTSTITTLPTTTTTTTLPITTTTTTLVTTTTTTTTTLPITTTTTTLVTTTSITNTTLARITSITNPTLITNTTLARTTSIRNATLTMMATTKIVENNNSLSKETNIIDNKSIKNLTKKEEIIKLNENNETHPVLFINSSTKTISINNLTLNLSIINQTEFNKIDFIEKIDQQKKQ